MPGNISVLFIMELIGTAAFSCSGAMVAIKKNLDLLGIVVLGVITAVGGGMIRAWHSPADAFSKAGICNSCRHRSNHYLPAHAF